MEVLNKLHHHLSGCGCRVCAGNARHTNESFIKKAKIVHGDKYDYSEVNYKNNKTKVKIICHIKDDVLGLHGEFYPTPKII